MVPSEKKLIDINHIVQIKAGSRAKYVPQFLINMLRNLVHEDEVNAFMAETEGVEDVAWLKRCVEFLKMDVKIVGLENLPENDGRKYTIVSNHPLGGADGVILGSIIGEHFNGNIRYLLNDLLTNLPPLKTLGIPINKTGAQSRNLPQMVDAGFRSDYQLMLFPVYIILPFKTIHPFFFGSFKTRTILVKSVSTRLLPFLAVKTLPLLHIFCLVYKSGLHRLLVVSLKI